MTLSKFIYEKESTTHLFIYTNSQAKKKFRFSTDSLD